MANQSHLKKLKEGSKSWNTWRTKNKEVIPDLSASDLTEVNPFIVKEFSEEPIFADLSAYNFSRTNLNQATLTGAKLKGADLSYADLNETDLYEADLRGANLKEAKLQKAILNYARLDEANLFNANLNKAQLNETNVKRANLKNATLIGIEGNLINLFDSDLTGADLTKAKMMEANCHGAIFKNAILIETDLLGANLSETNFSGADLRKANLSQASLRNSNFEKATISNADFSNSGLNHSNLKNITAINANFRRTYLGKTDMTGGNWEGTNFFGSNFSDADLTNSNLTRTDLNRTVFVKTVVAGVLLNNSSVYGISVWDLIGEIKNQKDLIITPSEISDITVDDLEMAQFIYLLLNNSKIRNAIDTITSKAVLILGRFYKERKDVLDALKIELRKRNYVPIVFDFEKPTSKDLTETVSTLAQISRFVIADISDAKSVPQELSHIIPHNPSLPVVTIISKKFAAYSMFEHFERYPWVLPLYVYASKNQLIKVISQKIIYPAEKKANELKPR